MTIPAKTPEEYIALLPIERQSAMQKLRTAIQSNIPKGFEETINYGMIGYVVPKSLYPKGYHCDPQLPLPFINIASQKNYISFYHMGMYADPSLYDWFIDEYKKHSTTKLDIGKSCIRFKKIDQIPYSLLGELSSKMTVEDWINLYESQIKISKK